MYWLTKNITFFFKYLDPNQYSEYGSKKPSKKESHTDPKHCFLVQCSSTPSSGGSTVFARRGVGYRYCLFESQHEDGSSPVFGLSVCVSSGLWLLYCCSRDFLIAGSTGTSTVVSASGTQDRARIDKIWNYLRDKLSTSRFVK